MIYFGEKRRGCAEFVYSYDTSDSTEYVLNTPYVDMSQAGTRVVLGNNIKLEVATRLTRNSWPIDHMN